jgi:hypothetical protein
LAAPYGDVDWNRQAQRRTFPQANVWLERALRQHDGGLSFTKGDPLLSKLRTDRGYDAMLQNLHLSHQPAS